MNTIVATDSASGITQEEATRLNIPILPVPFIINDKEYMQNVNMTTETFYERLTDDQAAVSTSQPLYGSYVEFWDKLLEEYDAVIYIPLSSGLSGSCQTSMMLAEEEYKGKVYVLDLQRISVSQRQAVLDAQTLIKRGKTPDEICRILTDMKLDCDIYIMLDTLKYLVKGGRLTPAAALIGNALNLKPILQIHGEKLDAFSKCRGNKKATKIMLNALRDNLDGKYRQYAEAGEVYLQIAHTNCPD
ncbi:MAG TPA: DegV family protein, partial [Candidatus Fimousia stercorigallinarum]|nr:DegV family protein [Candidatus Fimousia stercorigallinarum]